MKKALFVTIASLSLAAPAFAAADSSSKATSVTGDYVEARTAEVFTGGCIMGSEGETSGREAIMAWHVNQGQVNGVRVDGLSIVAVVAADRNLGTQEVGGEAPTVVKTALRVDSRATPEQRDALVTLARSLAPSLVRDVVDLAAVPIVFSRDAEHFGVKAAEATLEVSTHADHSPTCGAIQWFTPLARTTGAQVGTTKAQAWTGTSLGTEWSQGDKRSSFFGSFELR
jgi:hypothetical protein